MKTLFYYFLFVWYHYFADFSWKNVIALIFAPLIFILTGLKFIVFQMVIAILFVFFLTYGVSALIIGPCMWLFEKIFPDSPLFSPKKMSENFQQKLFKLSL